MALPICRNYQIEHLMLLNGKLSLTKWRRVEGCHDGDEIVYLTVQQLEPICRRNRVDHVDWIRVPSLNGYAIGRTNDRNLKIITKPLEPKLIRRHTSPKQHDVSVGAMPLVIDYILTATVSHDKYVGSSSTNEPVRTRGVHDEIIPPGDLIGLCDDSIA